eukprot:Nk52_evm27s151 gene=Nk52_evmTU27s151
MEGPEAGLMGLPIDGYVEEVIESIGDMRMGNNFGFVAYHTQHDFILEVTDLRFIKSKVPRYYKSKDQVGSMLLRLAIMAPDGKAVSMSNVVRGKLYDPHMFIVGEKKTMFGDQLVKPVPGSSSAEFEATVSFPRTGRFTVALHFHLQSAWSRKTAAFVKTINVDVEREGDEEKKREREREGEGAGKELDLELGLSRKVWKIPEREYSPSGRLVDISKIVAPPAQEPSKGMIRTSFTFGRPHEMVGIHRRIPFSVCYEAYVETEQCFRTVKVSSNFHNEPHFYVADQKMNHLKHIHGYPVDLFSKNEEFGYRNVTLTRQPQRCQNQVVYRPNRRKRSLGSCIGGDVYVNSPGRYFFFAKAVVGRDVVLSVFALDIDSSEYVDVDMLMLNGLSIYNFSAQISKNPQLATVVLFGAVLVLVFLSIVMPKPPTHYSSQMDIVYHLSINVFCVLIWYFFSSSITFYNKWLFSFSKFAYPLSISSVHMLGNFLLSWTIYIALNAQSAGSGSKRLSLGNAPTRPIRHFPSMARMKVMAVAGVATALDIGLSNVSLKFITVSFYTMVKASVPMWVYIVSCVLGLEKLRMNTAAPLVLVSLGVFMSAYGETHFDMRGFILVLLGSIMSGIRMPLSQIILQGDPTEDNESFSSPIDIMRFVSAPMFGVILPLALLVEGPTFFQTFTRDMIIDSVFLCTIGGLLAFCMAISAYLVISRTSGVTFAISGILKEVLTISIAVIYMDDNLSNLNASGLAVSLCGILFYKFHKTKHLSVRNRHSIIRSRGVSNRNSSLDFNEHEFSGKLLRGFSNGVLSAKVDHKNFPEKTI